MDANIGKRRVRAMIAADVDQSLRDTVEERLGTDKSMIGQHVRARCHMLAAAKADLEMQWACLPEQALRRHFAFLGHGNLRKQMVDKILLSRAQGLPLGAAVETVQCGRVAG